MGKKARIPEVALRAKERYGSSIWERARRLRVEEAHAMPAMLPGELEDIARELEVFFGRGREQERRMRRMLREGMPELSEDVLAELERAERALRGCAPATMRAEEAAEALKRAAHLTEGQARLYFTELAQRCLRAVSTSFSGVA